MFEVQPLKSHVVFRPAAPLRLASANLAANHFDSRKQGYSGFSFRLEGDLNTVSLFPSHLSKLTVSGQLRS
jgi:hypothetical protein